MYNCTEQSNLSFSKFFTYIVLRNEFSGEQLPKGDINQSVTPPDTASYEVCGENKAIRFSIHLKM